MASEVLLDGCLMSRVLVGLGYAISSLNNASLTISSTTAVGVVLNYMWVGNVLYQGQPVEFQLSFVREETVVRDVRARNVNSKASRLL